MNVSEHADVLEQTKENRDTNSVHNNGLATTIMQIFTKADPINRLVLYIHDYSHLKNIIFF